MYRVGDKVRIKRTNTIHEIESIVIVDSWSKAKLKGLCFTFSIGELSKDLDMVQPYQEPEFDFIATWQKEREFYLIESKGGSLSRMDKPEFEEYCEKMDRLNVKYRIIE